MSATAIVWTVVVLLILAAVVLVAVRISATKKRDRTRVEAGKSRERAASDEQTIQRHKSEAAGHHGDDPAHGGLATAHLHDRESGNNVVYGHRDETDTKTP